MTTPHTQVHRAMPVKSIRATSRECDFVASTDAIDAYEEVIDQTTWILDRYRQNPIVLYAHDSRDLPIGTCTRVDVVRGRLECTIKFCTAEENPRAEQVWRLVQAGTLRAVSVGFAPREGRFEMRAGREVFVLYNNELHEISVVPIPANPEALAKMKARARGAHASGAPLVATPDLGDLMSEAAMGALDVREFFGAPAAVRSMHEDDRADDGRRAAEAAASRGDDDLGALMARDMTEASASEPRDLGDFMHGNHTTGDADLGDALNEAMADEGDGQ